MSARRHDTLTGHWTGVYDYAAPIAEAVPFNAVLDEEGGALSGECVEPNTFSPDPVHELFASLSGKRDGAVVSFVKAYEGARRADHRVRYVGVANADLTRIDGEWTILDSPWGGSGPFVMNRADVGEAAEREVAVEAER